MTQLLTAFADGMLAFGALAVVCCLALWLLDKVDSRRGQGSRAHLRGCGVRVTDAELKVLAEAAENPPTIEPPVTEEHHDSLPIELMPTWKLIGALVADLEEARATIQALEREYNHAQEANKALGNSRFQALKDLEEAREENTKLREFRKVIYEHLDKALTAMDRWPRASAPREKWLIRWTYLLQAVSAGPRIEDVLDNVAATEQEEKQNA